VPYWSAPYEGFVNGRTKKEGGDWGRGSSTGAVGRSLRLSWKQLEADVETRGFSPDSKIFLRLLLSLPLPRLPLL